MLIYNQENRLNSDFLLMYGLITFPPIGYSHPPRTSLHVPPLFSHCSCAEGSSEGSSEGVSSEGVSSGSGSGSGSAEGIDPALDVYVSPWETN